MRSVPSDVIDEWIAFYMVEQFGDEWRQTATIAAEINFANAVNVASRVGEMPEIRTVDSFMPVPTDGEAMIGTKRALSAEETQWSMMIGFGFA